MRSAPHLAAYETGPGPPVWHSVSAVNHHDARADSIEFGGLRHLLRWFQYPLTQILGIRLRHCSPESNQCRHTRLSTTLWKSLLIQAERKTLQNITHANALTLA